MHGNRPSLTETLVDRFVRGDQTSQVALCDVRGQMTWHQLVAQAQVIAESLIALRASDSPVLIQTRRTRAFVAGVLGARLAGLPYVPLDDSTPPARRQTICNDSGAAVLITDRVPESPWEPYAETELVTIATRPSAGERSAIPKDVAYIVYTSGSTGSPKGCLVREQGLADMLNAVTVEIGLTVEDRWSCLHSFSFDVSVYEMWAPLLLGASASIISEDARHDPSQLAKEIRDYRSSVVSFTPSMLALFVDELGTEPLPDVRHILLAGEPVRMDDIRRLFESGLLPNARVWNLWGISEGTVHCTIFEISLDTLSLQLSQGTPIGRPLPHLTIELENDGVAVEGASRGEMVLGGSGVAWGYLNREELTEQRFVLDAATRLAHYRTGDFAYRGESGLMFLGRIDDQVKIRGYRVELKEVKTAIEFIDGVRAAVCVALRVEDRADLVLAAAVECADPGLDVVQIRRQLRNGLPSFMIPERMRIVASLPLNGNGKVDRIAVTERLSRTE